MRALSTCDFCGAEAAGTFAILPDELDPTEAEQRRVVLCSDCKERLETLLEPLLARAGADADDGGTAGSIASGAAEGDDVVREAGDARGTDGIGGSQPHDTARTDRGEPSDSASNEERVRERGRGETERPDGERGRGEIERPDGERGREGSERPGGADQGAETPPETEDAGPDGTGTPDADEPAASPPPNYPNVLRLLRNREFPMERAAVESLAAGAYDLEGPEVEAIVDHAIANGELVADGDQLRRP